MEVHLTCCLLIVSLVGKLDSALIPLTEHLQASSKPGLDVVTSQGQHEEIGSPLRVAQCRARCLQRFSEGVDRESTCLQGPDCFMCWENCELLQSNFPVWGDMCAEKRICFPGCQQACRFHRETAGRSQQQEPVILTRGEEVLTLSTSPSGVVMARWKTSPAPRQHYVVYVLMARSPGASNWRQISQSVDSEVRLDSGSNVMTPGTTVRVLVVDPEGLVTIYSPTPTTPVTVVPTLASMKSYQPTKAPTEVTTSTQKPPQEMTSPSEDDDAPWELQEVSLLHQQVLVIAEVAWTPRTSRGVYLVTWEVDGGGLKGNLFTDSTSVTLSLWPDTVYHIQVELVSRSSGRKKGPERSEPLIIDTHKAPKVAVETRSPSSKAPAVGVVAVATEPMGLAQAVDAPINLHGPRRQRSQLSLEMLAGTGAAMLLFLIVAMAWRCHRARGLGSNKRRLLLADDSISAGVPQPVVSVMFRPATSIIPGTAPKDCLASPCFLHPQASWSTDVSDSPLTQQDEHIASARHEVQV